MELKTSKDIFIYLAYPLFDVKDISEICGLHKESVKKKGRFFGLYKRKELIGKTGNGKGNQNPFFKGYGELSANFVSRIKGGAKRRNYNFNVTCKELWELFLQQNKKCYYTGLDLHIGNAKYNTVYSDIGNASVDRIDSSKGYISGNIVWCHKDINFMKQSLSHDQFLEYCKLITQKHG